MTNRESSRSEQLFAQAQNCIPGGVNSPVRAFGAVGGTPRFVARAQGAYIHDEDGQSYIDYIGSWGPMILGHQHPEVLAAIRQQLELGVSYGAPTALEIQMAELLCQRLPSMEQVRMVNSGTEATMSALRLARGFTGRDDVLKFEGCYHGHGDAFLVKAGSGALTFGVPTSPGVPQAATQHTLTLPYNDVPALEALFSARGDQLAAVIVEPIAGNMNFVPPSAEFLQTLRRLCDHHGSVLIFDEVMTGFRVGPQGAQGIYGIQPDLTTLGKIVGGGLPVGAFGGRRDIMSQLAPTGPVYQAGTLSGNPLAMAAGLATLQTLFALDPWEQLAQSTQALVEGVIQAAQTNGISACGRSQGSMFGLYFGLSQAPNNMEEVQAGDSKLFAAIFHGMLERGVYLAPSAFEAGFVSIMHGSQEVEQTIAAAQATFAQLSE
nr:glutamate-1-semialdehyde 2,1-aminomutase [Oceanococcus sp. HetDA_MAG_MS8]